MNRILINILLFFILISNLRSEEFVDPQGREFWLCFMQNHMDQVVDYNKLSANDPKRLHLDLFIASDTDATVTIDVDSLYTHDIIKVKAGEVYNYKVSPFAQIKSSEIIEKGLSVHIRSDVPITVYGLNRRIKTTDTFLAYPVDALGKTYRTANYTISVDLVSEFAIVATEDDTEVKIFPAVKTKDLVDSGNEITIKLNKGDIYQVLADKNSAENGKSDLTGSLIVSDKKIAVFSGHQCAYVPDDLWHCNHLVEQVPPVESWGRHYYLGKLQKRDSYTVRVIADQADTKVFVDSKLKTSLDAGQFLELALKNEVQITSNKRIMVAQYSHGSMRDSIGDPMMMMISPVQQYLKEYRFATPVNGSWNHSVDVIVPTNAINEVFLDDQKIDKNKFKKFKNTRYSIAYLNVEFGNHVLKGSEPFGMSTYGFGYGVDQFDAYGNNGGQSFVKLIDLDTLAPTIEITNNKKNENYFRDDRSNDKGLKSIKLLETVNMFFASDLLVESTPQISVFPRIQVPNVPGSIKN